jgi:hypothetical protein
MIHFYHVYAAGHWQEPVQEHIASLEYSGIAQHLTRIYVGYVGSDKQIAEAEQFIQERIPTTTIARSAEGWEQETMGHIPNYVTDQPVLYSHTKGASDPSPINKAWRRSMTQECIINWRRCLVELQTHDIVGCHWLMAADLKWFFGGTYWWANADYIRTLPEIRKENRFQAEHWIGLNPNVKAFDLKPCHPGVIDLKTDWRPPA